MLKRINDGIARGEAAVAVGMLLLMILVAFAQAFLRNMTNFGFGWANDALEMIDWADFVIQKGTLTLAFLGASLAAHADRHIAIDIVPRIAPPKVRVAAHGIVGIVGGVIAFYLARAFWAAVLINGEEIPAKYELLTMEGAVHVCDATAAQLADAGMSKGFYCVIRGFFEMLNVRMDTPGAAFQLIAPVMLVFISVRMVIYGVIDFVNLSRGNVAAEWVPHEGVDFEHEAEVAKKHEEN